MCIDQSRKKSKAPKPPSTEMQFDNNEKKDVRSSSTNSKNIDNRSVCKPDIENCDLASSDNPVNTAKIVDHAEIEESKTQQNANQEELLKQDERFSPEKENALQTLDAVIQEVENSLSKLVFSISLRF